MADTIGWGIIGCGKIARKFATGLKSSAMSRFVAAGSRSLEKAEEFAREFGADHPVGSYEELVSDPGVDAVYVATPHPFHREHTLLALEAGKAVLCEKPFALNADHAMEMISASRRKGVFLMEAMWSRFLPLIRRMRDMVHDGMIGELRMLQADFGFPAVPDPASRLFDPALGGGSLLDVGIYPVSLASFLFGRQPSSIASLANLGDTGVDEQAGLLFGYPGGEMAFLASAIRTQSSHEATVMGTKGYIRIHAPWWRGGSGMSLHLSGKEPEMVDIPVEGNGYNYEADEVCACLKAGRTESEHMSLDESLAIVRTLDEIRAQWGLRYPSES